MKRKYKRLIFRIISCLVAFVLAVLAAFFFTHRKVVENIEAIEISESTLPVIEVQTGGSYLNLMCGYTNDMIDRYMRGAVTPLPADRQLKIRITQGDEVVKGIRFEVRSLDSTELLENTKVTEWKEKSDDTKSVITAILPIQNLLEKDREYKLTIYLETEHHEEICYFTRVISSEKLSTAKMVDFVKNFHNKTLDSANASGMAVYLRSNTDTSASLGFVSLNSSYSKLLWNYLNPREIKGSTLEIIDINQTIGTFLMNSSVRFTDANGLDHDCDVEEVFTVQLSNGSWYMLNYERTANESLVQEKLRNGSTSLPLGIVYDERVHVLNSEKGLRQSSSD